MMRVSGKCRTVANSGQQEGMGCSTVQERIPVSIQRTLHKPGRQHSYRHQHRKANPARVPRRTAAVSKYLCFLWFLVICDSQTVSRVPFRTSWLASASSIGLPIATPHWNRPELTKGPSPSERKSPLTEADKYTDSIISSTGPSIVNHTKLQEIVMEGLGLSAIPNVRMMNVSQQEYETKYAEYLDRVNRRHTPIDGGPAGEDGFEQRRLFSFPGTDHMLNHRKLRRKRSLNNDYDLVYIRFDIPTRNASTGEMTGFQSPSLYHDPGEEATDAGVAAVADHPVNAGDAFAHSLHHGNHRQSLSELPPIAPENIEESSLNIMLTRRQNSARSTNAPHSKHPRQQKQQYQQQQQQQQQKQKAREEDKEEEEQEEQHQQQRQQPEEQQHQVQQPTQTPAQHHQQQLLQAHGHRRKGRVRFKQPSQPQQQLHHPRAHQAGRMVTIHVYQLVEPYERHHLTSKAIAVQEIAPNGSRWYQLPLEEAVRTWLDGSRKNLGLELYCEGCHAHGVYIVHDASPFFRGYDETPVLNVVGRLVQREKRSKVQRYRPTMRDYLSPPKTTACTAGNKRCCRHPLLVDFRDIEGFDFIIQPKIFDAGFCRGRCPTKFNPATHHALLQSLLHEHIKYDVPKPCCAPSSLDHIDVLHADPKNPQRLKVSTWHNMRVLECACS